MTMTVLEFLRGPGLAVSVLVAVAGIAWRLYGIFRLGYRPDHSIPRGTDLWSGALRTIATRSSPPPAFSPRVLFAEITGIVFHLGLFVIIFGYRPHVEFVRRYLGFGWPALPDSVVYFAGALTMTTLLVVLLYRASHPVLRFLSNFDDYFSWFMTFAPVVTGMMAFEHHGARNDALIAVHLATVELLLLWIPFGKLSHFVLIFLARGTTGALFARKGARS